MPPEFVLLRPDSKEKQLKRKTCNIIIHITQNEYYVRCRKMNQINIVAEGLKTYEQLRIRY